LCIKYITMSTQIRRTQCWCRRKEVILTLLRLTCSCLTLSPEISNVSDALKYMRGLSQYHLLLCISKTCPFFQSISFSPSIILSYKLFGFFIYLFSLINVIKINVNFVSVSFSLTIHSGAEDLHGNKRTNKKQSSDQEFEDYNLALGVSCLEGYPFRVFRYGIFLLQYWHAYFST
jgi:hypothetical protein